MIFLLRNSDRGVAKKENKKTQSLNFSYLHKVPGTFSVFVIPRLDRGIHPYFHEGQTLHVSVLDPPVKPEDDIEELYQEFGPPLL